MKKLMCVLVLTVGCNTLLTATNVSAQENFRWDEGLWLGKNVAVGFTALNGKLIGVMGLDKSAGDFMTAEGRVLKFKVNLGGTEWDFTLTPRGKDAVLTGKAKGKEFPATVLVRRGSPQFEPSQVPAIGIP